MRPALPAEHRNPIKGAVSTERPRTLAVDEVRLLRSTGRIVSLPSGSAEIARASRTAGVRPTQASVRTYRKRLLHAKPAVPGGAGPRIAETRAAVDPPPVSACLRAVGAGCAGEDRDGLDGLVI